MTTTTTEPAALVIDTSGTIAAFRLLSLRAALRLEAAGMSRRGPSALSIVRREFPDLKARTAAAMVPLYADKLRALGILETA